MASKIISGLLIAVTVYFGLSHGSRAFTKPVGNNLAMMTSLGITDKIGIAIGLLSIFSALLILFPQTFFTGNLLRAVMLILMMAFALKVGNYKFALIEVPFIIMPFVLIYLGHPFRKG